MADTRAVVDARLRTAFDTIEEGVDPVLRPSDRADFQANGALGLAKRLGRNPRELAEEVIARAELADICSVVEVSGPGFINLTLADGFLSAQVAVMAGDERHPIPPRSSSTTRRPTWRKRCTSGTCGARSSAMR